MENTLESSTLMPSPGEPRLRFWHMLVNPAATLGTLDTRPAAFLPLIAAALYAAVVNLYVLQRIGVRRVIEAAVRAAASVDTETLIANAMAQRQQIVVMQAVSAFAGSIIAALLLGLFFWLLVTVAGALVPFRRVLAVVAHVAFFTTIARETMIGLVVTVTRNLDAFNIRNPIATNLGFFIHTASPAMARLLGAADLITAAGLTLTIVGLRAVAKELSTVVVASIVLVPWVLYVAAGMWLPWLG